MTDSGYIGNVSVFQHGNNHVLIQILDDQWLFDYKYFDLHDCEITHIRKKTARDNLVKLKGKNKHEAFDIYQKWRLYGNKNLIIELADAHFPIEKNSDSKKEHQNHQINNNNSIKQGAVSIIRKSDPRDDNKKSKCEKIQITKELILDCKGFNSPNKNIKRNKNIRRVVEERGIQSLIHFTPIANLERILTTGLISRAKIDTLANRSRIMVNDKKRLDNQRNAICLSIEFPNYKMFYKYHNGNCNKWIVIKLKPRILWEYDCAFCHSNAASNECRYISINERKEVKSLNKMYEDFGNVRRKDLGIPSKYPTNPQAEVLVFNKIPLDDFLGIHFHNRCLVKHYKKIYKEFKNLFEFNRIYFQPRQDYQYWQNKNKTDKLSDDLSGIYNNPF